MLKICLLLLLALGSVAGGPPKARTEDDKCDVRGSCKACYAPGVSCKWSEDDRKCSKFGEGDAKEESSTHNCFVLNPQSASSEPDEVVDAEVPATTIIPDGFDDGESNNTTTQNETVPINKDDSSKDKTGEEDDAPGTTVIRPAPSTTPKTTPATTSSSVTTTSTATTTTTSTTTTPSTTPVKTTTTTKKPVTLPPVDPEEKSSFDGWSFFGGILLTLGFFSIGFVGLKYYRVRARTDADYNRF